MLKRNNDKPKEAGIEKHFRLIFYCANKLCWTSNGVAQLVLDLGYKNAYDMPDGIYGWILSGREVVKSDLLPKD